MFRKPFAPCEQQLLITFIIAFTAAGPVTYLTATVKRERVRITSLTVLAHSVAVGAGALVAWDVAGVVVFVFLVVVPIHSGDA